MLFYFNYTTVPLSARLCLLFDRFHPHLLLYYYCLICPLMIFVFGSFPFSVLSLVHVLLKLLYVSVSRGRLCYRTELFYFNYLSLLGLEHIYISYFLQQPKKSVCLQLLRTLLCFVFRSFRKSFFHVFSRLLITL